MTRTRQKFLETLGMRLIVVVLVAFLAGMIGLYWLATVVFLSQDSYVGWIMLVIGVLVLSYFISSRVKREKL